MLLQRFADVAITIYDARGHVVRQFDIGHQTAGNYISREKAIYWNGRNRSGEQVSRAKELIRPTPNQFFGSKGPVGQFNGWRARCLGEVARCPTWVNTTGRVSNSS